MGAKPPFNGTLGTDDRPTVIETELIELLTTDARSLVGVAEGATSTDGTVIYPSGSSPQGAPTDLAVQIDGTSRPVTGMEYVDGTGTARPVTQWHLGPLGEFTLTLDSLTFVEPATFDVAIASAGSAQPGGTLDVTADVTNTGDESGTQTVTLSIDNSVGQVDSASVTLSGGGSTTQTLSWAVPSGQTEQDYQATVASADDSASQTVTVGIATLGDTQYHTDAGSGSTLTDELGTVDATISGATWQTGTGITNAYLSFDGTDDGWSTNAQQDVSKFTVAAWVRVDAFDLADTILSAGGGVTAGDNGFELMVEGTDGELLTGYAAGGNADAFNGATPFVTAGNWGFAGLIYDGADSRLITFDTSQELADVTDTVSSNERPTGSEVYRGGRAGDGDHFNGALDFVMLNFGSTLSKSDLKTLWNDTKAYY